MKVIKTPAQMQKLALTLKKKKSIAFVPTMGFLHEGHLTLVRQAAKKAGVVIVSIFVNPSQFGKNEDFGRYPRDTKGDLAKLKKAGVDFVFMPTPELMYPQGFQTEVRVTEMSRGLCGESRPGHFQGVATVVLKLLNIVQPDFAIFGKKDFQQFQVIKTLVRDLNLPVKIIGAEIVREKDGLAMSSRNVYLSPSDRELALSLSKGLKAAKQACQGESLGTVQIKDIFLSHLPQTDRVTLDYIECVDAETLQPISHSRKGKTLLATAVFVGTTRLIDNIVF